MGTEKDIVERNDREDAAWAPPVTADEARQIAQRFIDAAFNNAGKPRPVFSIPCQPTDDDVRLVAFITQTAAQLTTATDRLAKAQAECEAWGKRDEAHPRDAGNPRSNWSDYKSAEEALDRARAAHDAADPGWRERSTNGSTHD